jgi:hypothetical protein
MTPTPLALGIHLCDYLIVEEGTRKATLVGCFTALSSARFPAISRPFCIYADLTSGEGRGVIGLSALRADTGDVFYVRERPIIFANRLQVVQFGGESQASSFRPRGDIISRC